VRGGPQLPRESCFFFADRSTATPRLALSFSRPRLTKKTRPRPTQQKPTKQNKQQTATAISASQYLPVGVDNAWDFDEFRDRLAVRVTRLTRGPDATLEFDLVGCDPSFANALRRILIAEVPTVAIEHVFVVNNTSIIADEVLAHRLGLVPLAVDARALEPRAPGDAAHERNTVVFKLDVSCRRDARDGGRVAGERVTAADLRWLPGGSQLPDETGCRFAPGGQAKAFGPGAVAAAASASGGSASGNGGAAAVGREAPRAVHPDLLLAKLKPGQHIALEAHCVVGTGREHAKWSPVATAWYRLLPEVALLPRAAELTGEDARALAAELPGLFSVGGGGAGGGAPSLVVADARDHELLLEKARRLSGEDRWRGAFEVRKRKDHFLFTVESTGAVAPDELVRRAVGVLADKARRLGQALR
jgi:DNA-directed RNA polymerases I and III subunit RPAC1